jgi:hypothetical protein
MKELLWIVSGLTPAKITLVDYLITSCALWKMFPQTVQILLSVVLTTMMAMVLLVQLVRPKMIAARPLPQSTQSVFLQEITQITVPMDPAQISTQIVILPQITGATWDLAIQWEHV